MRRFNSSRRQVMRSFTERTFYPTMYARNVLYGAQSDSYGVSGADVAGAVGALVGTLGTAALSAAQRTEQARVEQEAARLRQQEEEARAKAAEAMSKTIPWIAGAVGVAVVAFVGLKIYQSSRAF